MVFKSQGFTSFPKPYNLEIPMPFRLIIVSFLCLMLGACAANQLEPESDLKTNSIRLDSQQLASNYADIAEAVYRDSLTTARRLDERIQAFIAAPNKARLQAARMAWLQARIPYQQSEVFRFSNPIVDAWEGRVNAWPLDEGLIDYVDNSYGQTSEDNPLYTANVIAGSSISANGKKISTEPLSKSLLADQLHELGGSEANVAIGYHAIEFLLWGQDLNGTGQGAGNRLYTDYDIHHCTNGNCQRRQQYLKLASQVLIEDLQWMLNQWGQSGDARTAVIDDHANVMQRILTGMGSLSYGELAGERIQLGLLLGDPEEEHDCFSDNTHNSHYYNIVGIKNVYLGQYKSTTANIAGEINLRDSLRRIKPELAGALDKAIEASLESAEKIVQSAEESGVAYDQLIANGNDDGHLLITSLVDALKVQTGLIQSSAQALGVVQLDILDSESLNNPDDVFQ